MNRRSTSVSLAVCLTLFLSLVPLGAAQTSTETASALPRLVRFGGVVKDLDGNPLTGVVGITFSLYSEQTGGAPLWLETQNVTADSNGHYTAVLGATKPDGLPTELFTSVEARWVGVQVSGQAEQPRVLLVSAPYAFKAGDAETIGGLPPSAFVLANPAQSGASAGSAASAPASAKSSAAIPSVISGLMGYIPYFNDLSNDLSDSNVFQSPSGAIGILNTTPTATLDVNGTVNAAAGFSLGEFSFASGSHSQQNAFFGFAGNSTMTGTNNVAVGGSALAANVTGTDNVAIGGAALNLNTGNDNTATGFDALTANTSGASNTAIGWEALTANTTGAGNSALGGQALFNNSSGTGNVGVGADAGTANTTGSNNVFIGPSSQPASGNLTNATAIGANAQVGASNTIVLGSILNVNGCVSPCASTSVGIGTQMPAATLEVNGTAKFDNTVTFASTQKFPGTVSSVTAGSGLIETGEKTSPTLSLTTTCAANQILQWNGTSWVCVTAGTGTITGVTPGLGMMGGGTSGNVTLGLINTCSSGQVLEYNGAAWVCTGLNGGGTITGVTAGTDLTGGGTSGNVTLNLDTTKVPLLGSNNIFTKTQFISSTEIGVSASTSSLSNPGVFGKNTATSGIGTADGVYGESNSSSGSGVAGTNNSASGAANGVFGQSLSSTGTGVFGLGSGTGVTGTSNSTSGTGVYGTGIGSGVTGSSSSSTGTGVVGTNSATSGNAYGVWAQSSSPSGTGVYGTGGGSGVTGTSSSSTGSGVVGIMNSGGGYAGYFQGNVAVSGTLAIGGDTPMSHNPRMTFSGTVASFTTSPQAAGYFIPDQPIVITRFTAAVGAGQNSLCQVPQGMQFEIGSQGGPNFSFFNLETPNMGFVDSGPLTSYSVPAGTPLFINGLSASGGLGCQSGSNITATVEYAMQ